MTNKKIGLKIKKARKYSGKALEEVPISIKAAETGLWLLTRSDLDEIADFYGVPIEYFLIENFPLPKKEVA